jgi:signal transduction histidine kinase
MSDRLPHIVSHHLAHHALLIYLLVDAGGIVIEANPCSRTLLGEQSVTGHVNDIFVRFDDYPAIDITHLRRQPETPVLLSVSTATGLPESFLFHFLPIGDDTLVLGAVDILENQRLQHELLGLNRQLGELTRELQKKNHQLAELNQLKNRFLGMAAHDLRKPVSSILAYSEFLIDETETLLSDEHRDFLQIIHDSTALMRRLIDDFLDISLIESGHFPLHLGPEDIAKPLEHCVKLHAIMARKRGIALTVQRPPSPIVAEIDRYKIEQVCNNLIANAIEHAPDHSEVHIRLEQVGSNWQVAITDCGPGLDSDEAAALFQPFSRGKAGKAANSRSTGLGLAISKKIVTAHGGTIRVDSRPGHGARFSFSIPIHHNHQEKQS